MKRTTRMTVPPRHPYAGELVFTAFSGSHQDAINKGMRAQAADPKAFWNVPYLPLDPQDIGRSYEAIIRINAQSGKGGVAYVMENEFGYHLPKAMHVEFGKIINMLADETGAELTSDIIRQTFEQTYLQATTPFELLSFSSKRDADLPEDKAVTCSAKISVDGKEHTVQGVGNGPINAFMRAMKEELVPDFRLLDYSEHALQRGSGANAVAYIQIKTPSGGRFFGSAIDSSIEIASIKAMLSAINRALQTQE